MKVLVTGGAGFIGSCLSRRLIELGHDVTIIDDLSTGSLENVPKDSRFIQASILDRKAVALAMEGEEIVFHLAAVSSVALCNSNPYLAMKVNNVGLWFCAYQAVVSGVRKFVLASSASVYGDRGYAALKEDMEPHPQSVYANTKVQAEIFCQAGAEGLKSLILRYFNVIGDDQTLAGDWIIPNYFDCIAKGQSLKVYGTGKDRRDYIFVEDVVEATLLLAFHDCEGVYNVGTGITMSVNGIVDAFSTLYGRFDVEHIPARQGDLPYSCADILKLKSAGFEPQGTFLDGLKRIAGRKGLHAQPNQTTIDGDCAVQGNIN
jgi:UDP-glucose 4-epimerase